MDREEFGVGQAKHTEKTTLSILKTRNENLGCGEGEDLACIDNSLNQDSQSLLADQTFSLPRLPLTEEHQRERRLLLEDNESSCALAFLS